MPNHNTISLADFGHRIGIPTAKLRDVQGFDRTETDNEISVILNSEKTITYLRNRTQKGNVSQEGKRLAAAFLSEITDNSVVVTATPSTPKKSSVKAVVMHDDEDSILDVILPSSSPERLSTNQATTTTVVSTSKQHWALYVVEALALVVLLSASTYISSKDAERFRPDMTMLSRTAMVIVLELVGLMVLYYNAKKGNGTSETKVLRLYTVFWILPCSLQYWIDGVDFSKWEHDARFVLEGTLFACLASCVFSFGHYYVSKIVSSWF